VQRWVGSLVAEQWEQTMQLPDDGDLLHWMEDDIAP
jgi:hypothetical protein